MTKRPKLNDSWQPAIKAGLILLLTVIAYAPVFQAGYIWDDEVSLTRNPLVQSPSGLYDFWFTTRPYDYFPLTFTSFWIEWQLWGANPLGYHVVNVLLHALGAVLLWRVLLRLKVPGAWLAATFFAVHPVCVASVAWVAERKNTLSIVFFFLSILWYLRSEIQIGNRQSAIGNRKWYWLSLLAFLLALFAKTSVVTLPIVLWLCVWWRRQRNAESPTHSPTHPPTHPRRDLVRLAPFFALSLALGLITVWFQSNRAMSGEIVYGGSLGERLLGGSWAVWFYLWKALWPLNLSMIYPRWDINPASLASYVPALLWLALLILCWRFRRTWGAAVLVGLGSFLVLLLPVLGFFDMYFLVYSRVADHWQYLALPVAIALVVGGVARQVNRWGSAKVGTASAFAVVALLSALTWRQAGVYKNEEVLWRDTIEKNPNAWVAYNNLGLVVTNLEERIHYYREALRIKPDYALAHNNLGCALLEQGKFDEAVMELDEALRLKARLDRDLGLKSSLIALRNNLGKALMKQGQSDKALVHFEESLRLDPKQPDTQLNVGGLLFNQGKFADAANRFREALRLKPDYVNAHYNLAMAFLRLGQTNDAIREFSTTLQLKPDHTAARLTLDTLRGDGRK